MEWQHFYEVIKFKFNENKTQLICRHFKDSISQGFVKSVQP